MARCMLCGKVKSVMNCVCSDCLPKREKRGKLPKAELDGMIEAERAYWTNILGQTEDDQRELLYAMSAARGAMGAKVGYLAMHIHTFLGALLNGSGLANDMTNQEIYTILQLLGWDVYEEAKPDGTDL